MDWFNKRFRKLHLDFHTGSCAENLLCNFDAKDMIAQFKETQADVIITFAKDHHGHAYYPTDVGYRHPSLKTDMLGNLVKEGHRADMKVIAYFSIGWDNRAANEHPDWHQINKDGNPEGSPNQRFSEFKVGFKGRWQNVCYNTGYGDYTLSQMEEVLKSYPVDGIWMDILGYGANACYCEDCKKGFTEYTANSDDSWALSADEVQKVQFIRWKNYSCNNFIQRVRDLTDKYRPDAVVMGHDFLVEEAHHPAYSFQSYISRAGRSLAEDKSFEVVTPRFFNVWGEWTLKPADMIKQELITIAANGCMTSLGDQIYPDGTLDKGTYDTFKEVFSWLKERETSFRGFKSAPDVLVLDKPEVSEVLAAKGEVPIDEIMGIARILSEGHRHADFVSKLPRDISQYSALILPEQCFISEEETSKIKDYVRSGGIVVGTGRTSMFDEHYGETNKIDLSDLFGVNLIGESSYSVNYYDLSEEINSCIPDTPVLIRDRVALLSAVDGARSFANVNFPLVETTDDVFVSHQHAPPDKQTDYPFVTAHKYGKGTALFFACAIGRQYWLTGNPWIRRTFLNTLHHKDFDNRKLKIKAPISVEVSLMQDECQLIIHLINFHGERPFCKMWNPTMRAAYIEDILKVHDIEIEVSGGYAGASLCPDEGELLTSLHTDKAILKLSSLHIHSSIILRKI